MKLLRTSRAQHAYSLIECLLYIGLLALVCGFAVKVFIDCWDNSTGIRQNTSQVAAVIAVGERWRQEVRQLTKPIEFATNANGVTCHLVTTQQAIDYRWENNSLWRRTGDGPWTLILPRIKAAAMTVDKQTFVTGWRWEIECLSRYKQPKYRPSFTFEAVSTNKFL